ncbi:MAG: ice-binding family protein [Acidimicrobiales bacterium]
MKKPASLMHRLFAVLLAVTMAGAVLSFGSTAYAADVATVPLGTAVNYSVLGGSTVTNTGATVLNASLGLSPGTSITGFPPGLVNAPGTTETTTPAAQQAQADLTAAYVNAAGRPINATTTADLANLVLVGGVYAGPGKSALSLTGPLVLDGGGNANSVFIFQTDSSLTTGSGSSISLINGAQECNVFWQVGSSATLGTSSVFAGNILALSSVTVTTSAVVHGRALARNAAVTLDTNTFTVPTCALPIDAGRQTPPVTTAPSDGTTAQPGQPGTSTDQPGSPTSGQPGTPTGQSGVPPTNLAFTGPRVVLPLVLALVCLTLGTAALSLDKTRKQRIFGPPRPTALHK